jgi:hypothetical protein
MGHEQVQKYVALYVGIVCRRNHASVCAGVLRLWSFRTTLWV